MPPLRFPVQTWPNDKDPSFIGPFYSRCRIGRYKESDVDKRRPGVYFRCFFRSFWLDWTCRDDDDSVEIGGLIGNFVPRLERDLPARFDQMGVEIFERAKWDIRQGMVGAENFIPRHALIATWKNLTFVGGFNSFEVVSWSSSLLLLLLPSETNADPCANIKTRSIQWVFIITGCVSHWSSWCVQLWLDQL